MVTLELAANRDVDGVVIVLDMDVRVFVVGRRVQKRGHDGWNAGDARTVELFRERQRLVPGVVPGQANDVEDVEQIAVAVEVAEVILAHEVDKRRGATRRGCRHAGHSSRANSA